MVDSPPRCLAATRVYSPYPRPPLGSCCGPRETWNPIYNAAIQEHEKPGNLLLVGIEFRGDALRDMPEPLAWLTFSGAGRLPGRTQAGFRCRTMPAVLERMRHRATRGPELRRPRLRTQDMVE